MQARIIKGTIDYINDHEIGIDQGEQYEFARVRYDGPEIEDEEWVLAALGKHMTAKVIDDVIKEIEVHGLTETEYDLSSL